MPLRMTLPKPVIIPMAMPPGPALAVPEPVGVVLPTLGGVTFPATGIGPLPEPIPPPQATTNIPIDKATQARARPRHANRLFSQHASVALMSYPSRRHFNGLVVSGRRSG